MLDHLATDCPRCRKEIAPLADAMFRPGRSSAPPVDDSTYAAPLERAMATTLAWSRRLAEERREAQALLPQLLCGVPGFRQARWTRGLCELLLMRSWGFRHSDPKEMLYAADLAREASDRLDTDIYGWKETNDLRARAWGEYANACRVTDDLVRAEWALDQALQLHKDGTGAALLRARLAEVASALLSHQRRFPASFQALDLAHVLYRRYGKPQDAVRVLVKRGIYTGRSGDPEMAIGFLARALNDMRGMKDRDPKLLFLTMHNLLLFRVEKGEFREASRQLFEMRPLYARNAGPADLVKLRWIEARIAAGLGETERAERAFQQVWEEFGRQGQVYHAAVAGLELAACWLHQGRVEDVKVIVQDILNVFRTRYVAREAIGALLLLRESLDQNLISLEILAGICSLIGQHQEEGLDGLASSEL